MKCKICKQEMKEISNTHLKKHNLTKSKYAEIDKEVNKIMRELK